MSHPRSLLQQMFLKRARQDIAQTPQQQLRTDYDQGEIKTNGHDADSTFSGLSSSLTENTTLNESSLNFFANLQFGFGVKLTGTVAPPPTASLEEIEAELEKINANKKLKLEEAAAEAPTKINLPRNNKPKPIVVVPVAIPTFSLPKVFARDRLPQVFGKNRVPPLTSASAASLLVKFPSNVIESTPPLAEPEQKIQTDSDVTSDQPDSDSNSDKAESPSQSKHPSLFSKKTKQHDVTSTQKAKWVLQSALEQIVNGLYFTAPMIENLLVDMLSFIASTDKLKSSEIELRLNKILEKVRSYGSESGFIDANTKGALLTTINDYVAFICEASPVNYITNLQDFLLYFMRNLSGNNPVVFVMLQFIVLDIGSINKENQNDLTFEVKALDEKECSDALILAKKKLLHPYVAEDISSKEGFPSICKGIYKLMRVAQTYKELGQQQDFLKTVKLMLSTMETTADKLGAAVDQRRRDINYSPLARAMYLKISYLLYNAAIILNERMRFHSNYRLYLSPIYVFYSLAEQHATFESRKYFPLMRDYIQQRSIAKLAAHSSATGFKQELADYEDYLGRQQSTNALGK